MDSPEILIVGAGPAGLTAGIYAARAGHKVLAIERAMPGGQVARTPEVENYPGFAKKVNALELAQAMEQQARTHGCEIEMGEVSGLTTDGGSLAVSTTLGEFRPGSLIIASGVESRKLELPNEDKLRGRGVSYCAICDGAFFKDKEVAVVGGGDSALDEALYLAGVCSKVHIIHRRDEFRATRIAQDRVRATDNIELVLSSVVTAINGDQKLDSLDIESVRDRSKSVLEVAGLFIYVGSSPNTNWCRGTIDVDETGFIKSNDRLETNVPGVFVAGDVRVTWLRQIATAVGDGALAAMVAHQHLIEKPRHR